MSMELLKLFTPQAHPDGTLVFCFLFASLGLQARWAQYLLSKKEQERVPILTENSSFGLDDSYGGSIMLDAIVWLAVGAMIGAVVSVITRRSVEPYLIIDILARSSGALLAGLLLALLLGMYNIAGMYTIVPSSFNLVNFPVFIGSIVGALFFVALANILFDAVHHEER